MAALRTRMLSEGPGFLVQLAEAVGLPSLPTASIEPGPLSPDAGVRRRLERRARPPARLSPSPADRESHSVLGRAPRNVATARSGEFRPDMLVSEQAAVQELAPPPAVARGGRRAACSSRSLSATILQTVGRCTDRECSVHSMGNKATRAQSANMNNVPRRIQLSKQLWSPGPWGGRYNIRLCKMWLATQISPFLLQ